MAKKEKSNEINVNEQIKKTKKKLTVLILIMITICVCVGSLIGYSLFQKNATAKLEEQKKIEARPLKDFPIDESEKNKIYSRDIPKQTYMLKDGALLFEGTIIFHNKLCANLYSGVADRKSLEKNEPVFEKDTDVIGDKVMKDAINKYLQETDKSNLSTAYDLSDGLSKAINKQFKDIFGHEVVKNILISNHIIQ